MNVLFDLDGTLTDPLPGIARSIQRAVVALGGEPPEIDGLKRFIGPPLRASLVELLGTTDPVYGSELDGRLVDKAELIHRMLQEEDLVASETWMIGDRAADVLGGKEQGTRTAAVLWGYASADELAAAAPDVIVRAVGELAAAIASKPQQPVVRVLSTLICRTRPLTANRME